MNPIYDGNLKLIIWQAIKTLQQPSTPVLTSHSSHTEIHSSWRFISVPPQNSPSPSLCSSLSSSPSLQSHPHAFALVDPSPSFSQSFPQLSKPKPFPSLRSQRSQPLIVSSCVCSMFSRGAVRKQASSTARASSTASSVRCFYARDGLFDSCSVNQEAGCRGDHCTLWVIARSS